MNRRRLHARYPFTFFYIDEFIAVRSMTVSQWLLPPKAAEASLVTRGTVPGLAITHCRKARRYPKRPAEGRARIEVSF